MFLQLLLLLDVLVNPAPLSKSSFPVDCEDVYNMRQVSTANKTPIQSGVYTIYPAGPEKPVQVFCDMSCSENNNQDGRWTVIQRRINGSVSFYRPWELYKEGFGNATGEYWFGLENIFLMTYSYRYQLRVDMEDFAGGSAFAHYTMFYVDPESRNYRLHVSGYVDGGAGDSLSYSNERDFATFDKDPTGSCADTYGGGFWYNSWYNSCLNANPNGLYKQGTVVSPYTGISWNTWKGSYYSLKKITMKIRRANLEDLKEL